MKTSSFLDLWFGGFNTASGMDCMQSASRCSRLPVCQVSIPQAVRIACNVRTRTIRASSSSGFQYRKRYGLHAIRMRLWRYGRTKLGFNTASGTDCMQFACVEGVVDTIVVSIPQAVRIACNIICIIIAGSFAVFQYRKRYGLHAIRVIVEEARLGRVFQYRKRYGLHAMQLDQKGNVSFYVSIPQAVRIACNTVSRSPWKQ